MKSISKILLTLFLGSLLFSCSESSPDEPLKLPDNLLVSVEYLGNGVVKATFTAENATFFKVNFGTPGETMQRVDGNSASKTYTEKGNLPNILCTL